MQKKALILGINGQDGSYLAEILLERGYEVHGVVRRNSQPNLWRIQHILDQLVIHQGDLLDFSSIYSIFWKILPDEIYNEADQDHIGFSQATPSYSAEITYGAVANLLELVRQIKQPKIKLFQPVSATMFGNAPAPQDEETPFDPQSPYAISKLAAYYLCKHYREKHGLFVSTAILYNHDSVRRQGDYLLHYICKAAVRISHGDAEELSISNPDLRVDIGCAREYMEAIYKLMQLDSSIDLVIGSGFAGTIYSFVQTAFGKMRIPMNRLTTTIPTESSSLLSDCSKAMDLLWFKPQRSVYQIIVELCDHYTDILYGGK